MKTAAVVGERGQVTIPKRLRKSLGMDAGAEIYFEEKDGRLIGSRAVTVDPIEAMIGIGKRADVDALLADLRGPAWHSKIDSDK